VINLKQNRSLWSDANSSLSPSENLKNYIVWAKSLSIFNDSEHQGKKGWDANKWSWKIPSQKTVSMTFGFTNKSHEIINYFNAPFMEYAKAYVKDYMTVQKRTNIQKVMAAFKEIHNALETNYSANPACILYLDQSTQELIATRIKANEKSNSWKKQVSNQIFAIYRHLVSNHLVPNLDITKKNPFQLQNSHSKTGKERKEWEEERCPTNYEMLAFAECFATAINKNELWVTSVGALLCHAPSRNIETRSLDITALQEEDDGSYYLQWWGAKGFGAKREPVLKYMQPVVQEAYDRLINLSEPARKMAKWAHDHPNKFYRHEACSTPENFGDDEPLNPVQLAHAVGLCDYYLVKSKKDGSYYKKPKTWSRFPQKYVKKLLADNDRKITYNILGKYFYEKYSAIGWKIPQTDRPIWESLLLTRDRETDVDDASPVPFSWVLPSTNMLNYTLGKEREQGNGKLRKSMFEERGILNEDGRKIQLSSHQFRVWLNTHAQRAGVSDYDIALWSGRASPEQNKAYDLRSESELQNGSFELANPNYFERPSNVELAKINIPIEAKSVDVDMPGVVEKMELGLCAKDYAQGPCFKCGECITCTEYICVKGFPKTLQNLKSDANDIIYQLKKAKKHLNHIEFGKDRTMTNLGWKLAHYLTFIKILEDENTPEGALIRIPASHDPSPIRRELIAQGLIVEEYPEDKNKGFNDMDENLLTEMLNLELS
jgi:hypothetical protein